LEALPQSDSPERIPTGTGAVKQSLPDAPEAPALAADAREKREAEERSAVFTPKIGEKAVFHAKNKNTGKEVQLIGEITELDDLKGTVTMKIGDKKYKLFRGNGYFTRPSEVPREQTMEYALEAAQKLAGQDGKAYFARKDGDYKGKILEITPAYAIQGVGREEKTIMLHRLKDFGSAGFDLLQKGADVVIKREIGRCSVSKNERKPEQDRDRSIER
jgi:hypothetical protein